MESIESFKSARIDNLNAIVGGRNVVKTGANDTKDKLVISNEGCVVKHVWRNDGTRYVLTFSNNCYDNEERVQQIKDGNKAGLEYTETHTYW
jgi:hypothetical protein